MKKVPPEPLPDQDDPRVVAAQERVKQAQQTLSEVIDEALEVVAVVNAERDAALVRVERGGDADSVD